MPHTKVSMIDMNALHAACESEIIQAIQVVAQRGDFINGKEVTLFAEELAEFLSVPYVIPCGNGTDALQLAYMVLDLPLGAEIILPSFSYVAAAEAAVLLGLKPVFAEVCPFTFAVLPQSVEQLITPNTKAIVAVHLFGQAAYLEELQQIAERHRLFLIEDTAQALGATTTLQGKQHFVGTIGHIGTTSFFPTKTLGAWGDGGAVFTKDTLLAQKLKALASHGQQQRYHYEYIGINSRLDTLQAAVLRVKLKYLNEHNLLRQKAAQYYDSLFAELPLQLPQRYHGSSHVFHQYTIQVTDRDNLKNALQQQHIQTMVYYPKPLHLQSAYQRFWQKEQKLSVSEQLSYTVLSLPISPFVTKEQQELVSTAIKNYYLQSYS